MSDDFDAPRNRKQVTPEMLEESAIIELVQTKRLEAILNEDVMDKETLKLLSDTVKTTIDIKRIKTDEKNSAEDRGLIRDTIAELSKLPSGFMRQKGAGNRNPFPEDDDLPDIRIIEGQTDTDMHEIHFDPKDMENNQFSEDEENDEK